MMIASTNDDTPIEELAQLVDKVMEVAIPTMLKVSDIQSNLNDAEVLQSEIASFKQEVKTQQQAARNQIPHHRSPSPCRYSSNPSVDHSS